MWEHKTRRKIICRVLLLHLWWNSCMILPQCEQQLEGLLQRPCWENSLCCAQLKGFGIIFLRLLSEIPWAKSSNLFFFNFLISTDILILNSLSSDMIPCYHLPCLYTCKTTVYQAPIYTKVVTDTLVWYMSYCKLSWAFHLHLLSIFIGFPFSDEVIFNGRFWNASL